MLKCQQPRSGVYNEHVFQALDYVLDQASQHGMRVIIALTDYWKITDGVQQARLACAHAQLNINLQAILCTPGLTVVLKCAHQVLKDH